MKKKVQVIAVVLALCLGVTACGGGESDVPDVPVSEIVSSLDGVMPANVTMDDAGEMYFKSMLGIDESLFTEYTVKVNSMGTTVDEFGVFKAADGKIKDLQAAVDGYLQKRVDSWMEEYMPEEKPKVTSAKSETIGSYVMYTILSDVDRAAAVDAFASALA